MAAGRDPSTSGGGGGGTKVGDAFVEIGANTAPLRGGLAESKKQLSAWGTRTTGAANVATRGIARFRTMVGLATFAISGLAARLGIATIIKSFMAQEQAAKRLGAAIAAQGGEVRRLLPGYKAFASAIQRVTRYGDEALMEQMAFAVNMGVTTDQLEDATKAAVGLAAKYQIDLKTSMMLVGRASQGQTQMLTRYGIVLAETLSPQEKFNKLLEIGAGAFRLAEADAKTLAGAQEQMKNALGDSREELGGMYVDLVNLRQVYIDVAKKAFAFNDEMRTMRIGGAFIRFAEEFKAAMKMMWNAIMSPFRVVSNAFGTLFANIVDNARIAGLNMWRALFEPLKGGQDFVWHSFSEGFDQAFDDILKRDQEILDEMNANIERRTQAAEDSSAAIVDAEDEVTKAKQRSMGVFQSFGDIVREAQKYTVKIAAGAAGAAGGKPLSRDEANAVIRVEQDKEATDLLRSMDDFLKKIEGKLPSPVFS